jgi:type VI secretion system secreted protein VgrG
MIITRIVVNIDGTSFKNFDSLSIAQRFERHHTMHLNLGMDDLNEILQNGGAGTDLNALTKKWIGKKISVELDQGEVNALGILLVTDGSTINFEGIISKIQLQMRDAVDSSVLISVISPTVLLDTGEHTRAFVDKKLSEIVEAVAKKPMGKGIDVKVSNDLKIPYVTQYRESNYHFLQRLAAKYGEWFYYNGRTLLFGKEANGGSGPAVNLEYGSNLTEMNIETNLVPLNSEAYYYDYYTDSDYTVDYGGIKVKAQNYAEQAKKTSEEVFSSFTNTDLSFQNHRSQSTQNKVFESAMNIRANSLCSLKGSSTCVKLCPGATISVKDNVMDNGLLSRTDPYGEYVVVYVNHYVDATGSYYNEFEAVPSDPTYAPVTYPITQPVAETQLAQVKSTADPDAMGRVKVAMVWQQPGEQESIWISVSQPMSSQDRGVYFVPEVDEMVYVDFEYGNPDLPFVRGTFNTGTTKPGGLLFSSDNVYKGIITKGGNHILIDDTGGKESIHLYNKDKTNEIMLTMQGNGEISIRSDTKIIMGAPDIIMKAENIVMSASDAIQMEGNRVKVAAQLALILDVIGPLLMSSKSLAVLDSMGNTAVGGKSELALGSLNVLEVKANQITVAAESAPKMGDYKLYDWIPVDLPDSVLSGLMSIPSPIFDKANKISTSSPKEASLTLKSDSKALFESKMNLNVKADMSVEVDGNDVLMEAKGVSKLKGGATVEIKGKMVTIN